MLGHKLWKETVAQTPIFAEISPYSVPKKYSLSLDTIEINISKVLLLLM